MIWANALVPTNVSGMQSILLPFFAFLRMEFFFLNPPATVYQPGIYIHTYIYIFTYIHIYPLNFVYTYMIYLFKHIGARNV